MMEGFTGAVDNTLPTEFSGARHHPSESRYIGIVSRGNGKWAAQIYLSHEETWLGTFNRQDEASREYDRDNLKLRKPEKQGSMNILREQEIEEAIKL